jgi:hypothetical protein
MSAPGEALRLSSAKLMMASRSFLSQAYLKVVAGVSEGDGVEPAGTACGGAQPKRAARASSVGKRPRTSPTWQFDSGWRM